MKRRKSVNTVDILNNVARLTRENVRVGYLEDILHAYTANKFCTKSARTKDYLYDDTKYPIGKSTVEASLKSADVTKLLKAINEDFSEITGIPKQS